MNRPRSTRRPAWLALGAVVALGVILLIAAAMRGTLVYYRTTSEVVATPPGPGQRIRLGGAVVPGSLQESGGRSTFRLTDGRRQVTVVERGQRPGTFREGQDAVVEGVLDAEGIFESDTVMVKHSNEYRPGGGTR